MSYHRKTCICGHNKKAHVNFGSRACKPNCGCFEFKAKRRNLVKQLMDDVTDIKEQGNRL